MTKDQDQEMEDINQVKKERTSLFVFVIGKEENRKVGECKDSDKGGCLPRVGCTCQLPGLHKVYHDDDDTYL